MKIGGRGRRAARLNRLLKKLQFASHVPPAKAGSGRKINGLTARLNRPLKKSLNASCAVG
jgi:hypothetical protein